MNINKLKALRCTYGCPQIVPTLVTIEPKMTRKLYTFNSMFKNSERI